ncbi:MAG: sporulation protein [Lachnospiraceae bacterium]|jgi:stage III sporulation protein AE|nr:sporulation protein [Lachnospiraceae bacterium]
MREKRRWVTAFFMVIMLSFGGLVQEYCLMEAEAAEKYQDDYGIPTKDWSQIEQFLQQKRNSTQTEFTFSGLVKALMEGKITQVGHLIFRGFYESLLQEVANGSHLAGELLALGLIGAVFANFSNVFSGSQISETAFFMTYLLVFTVLASAFSDSMAITGDVLTSQMEFMKVLLPCYFPAAAWAGGSISTAAWMELLLFLIGAVQWLYLNLLLPMARVYILFVMAGNMVKEDMLSRFTGLLQSVIQWGSRSLVGLVLGFQLVQGLVLPYADSVHTAGIHKLLEAIPGIGDGAGVVTKMVLGTGVLVKNTMGAAAVVILMILSILPLLKLAILMLLYRSVAGILQPVGDKRLVACVGSVADGQKLLLTLAASGLLLFSVTIALICLGTNGAYMGI